MLEGTHRYFLQERVIYGRPAAEAVATAVRAVGPSVDVVGPSTGPPLFLDVGDGAAEDAEGAETA